jgi:hypothetical protein
LNLNDNKLTSINIPATLTALLALELHNNQLTSINIPDGLTALQILGLGHNQLTSINMPAKLIALKRLNLQQNQLTSINIPATLTALRTLFLGNNQLTSINIPATLIALETLGLENNQLTAATKIALIAFGIIRPALQILIEENIPEQLTPAILQEHFQTIASTCLSIISSKIFKDKVLDLYTMSKGLPLDILSSHISWFIIENNAQELLLANIAMLRRCFANNKMEAETLSSWLTSPEMESITSMINQKQNTKINKLLEMYDRKFLDISRMPHKKSLVASSVAAITWRHNPTLLTDNTPIDPKQNPFQLVPHLKPKI